MTIIPYIALHIYKPAAPFDPHSGVAISDDGRYDPFFFDGNLERFFSKVGILEFKEKLKFKTDEARKPATARRRKILRPIIKSVSEWLIDNSVVTPLSVRLLNSIESQDDSSDDDIARYHLSDLARILIVCDDCGVKFPPERGAAIREFAKQIAVLDEQEKLERADLIQEIKSLNTPLSFGWLYTEDALWVIEVTFWSFLGVIANTIIALILACRSDKYAPAEFVLVFPKIFMAPLLAVVVVALWSSGFSESKISYLNLPYFLVFSFLLGFGTEALYEKLRDLTALIVTPAATLSEKKVEEASRNVPYQYQTPDVKAGDLSPAHTLAEVEKNMSTAIKARLERSIVAHAAVND